MIDSLFETHQQSTSEIQPKLLSHFKTFRFYVFLDREKHQPLNSFCNLQRVNFKLREQRNSHDKYSDNKKQIHMSFHDLQDQLQTHQALQQLKNQGKLLGQQPMYFSSKVRFIVYARQSTLIRLLKYAKALDVKLQSIPIVLYSPGINNDLAAFLGWGKSTLGNLFQKALGDLQPQCKKWIQSPTQKIDSWTVDMVVQSDTGQIYRYNKVRDEEYMEQSKQIQQGFFSSVSIGTHPKLFMDFQHRRQNQSGLLDNLFYKLQGFKKFCCVGDPNMKAATGVVNAQFTDDTGQDHEIFREFKGHSQGLQDQENQKTISRRHRKRILSIVVSNIDRFHGNKLEHNQGFKMNDNKLELLTFESLTDYTKIGSISGDIKLSLESEKSVYVQVNNSCFRLVNPQAIIIRKSDRYKVLINKETLGC